MSCPFKVLEFHCIAIYLPPHGIFTSSELINTVIMRHRVENSGIASFEDDDEREVFPPAAAVCPGDIVLVVVRVSTPP